MVKSQVYALIACVAFVAVAVASAVVLIGSGDGSDDAAGGSGGWGGDGSGAAGSGSGGAVSDRTYTVYFDSRGGSAVASESGVREGSPAREPASPTKEGREFLGWYRDLAHNSKFDFSSTIFGDIALYAKWSGEDEEGEGKGFAYAVSFDVGGGSPLPPMTEVRDGSRIAEPPTPVREGYGFGGWYSDPELEVPWLFESSRVSGNATIYAKWVANEYKVDYQANAPAGASAKAKGSTDPSDHEYGSEKALEKNGFTVEGWTFKGWNTMANGKGTSYADGEAVLNLTSEADKTVHLFAQWKANEYRVYYDGNAPPAASVDGSTGFSTHVYDVRRELNPCGFSLAGWDFKGWIDANGAPYADGEAVLNLTAEPGGSVTLYAVWEQPKYTVSFYSQGVLIGTGEAIVGSPVGEPAEPERAGYGFDAWYADEDFKDKWSFDDAPASDMSLYANWTANRYDVVYDGNKPPGASGNVTGSTGKSEHTYDAESLLSDNGFTLTGWSFAGWNTVADGSGDAYAGGADAPNLTEGTDDVTLYAQWVADEYSIKYDGNKPGAASNYVTGTMDSSDHVYDTESGLAENEFELVGWRFVEWNTQADGSGKSYSDEAPVKTMLDGGGDTLYARWEANEYFVEYDMNKPSKATRDVEDDVDNTPHVYDTESNLSSETYSLFLWYFVGWNTEANGSGYAYGSGAAVSTLFESGTGKLYAQWKQVPYHVVYYPNKPAGASANVEGTMSEKTDGRLCDEYSEIIPNTFSLVGWKFTGWVDGRGEAYLDKGLINNLYSPGGFMPLYAQWEANEYHVKYVANKPAAASSNVTGTMDNSDHVYDAKSGLRSCGFSLAGWNFIGWTQIANGNGTIYEDGADVETLSVIDRGVVNLYAKWEVGKYKVVYDKGKPGEASGDVDIGQMAMESEFECDTASQLTASQLTLAGWTFAGWRDASNEAVTYADGADINCMVPGSEITLVAIWTPKEYTVTYVYCGANEGDTRETDTVTYDRAFTLAAPMRAPYGFGGWFDAIGGAGTQYSGSDSIVSEWTYDGDITLYAHWVGSSDLSYTESGDDYIADGSSASGDAFIPDYYNGKKVTGIDGFAGNANITSLTIPGTISEIRSGAFEGCTGVTGVTIQEGCTAIGSGAFKDCTSLQEVHIPRSVETIAADSFEGCDLERIYTPLTPSEFPDGWEDGWDQGAEIRQPED
ncbi:MAG: InlB B-repeat-containing protein [Candidatus Methanoplasma sp.]|jgi:uncharacterized repeat protein (TIGR02543 family)|nr:InlB B-repeat-containing protein [Candidatus Methanoplasma sp.]